MRSFRANRSIFSSARLAPHCSHPIGFTAPDQRPNFRSPASVPLTAPLMPVLSLSKPLTVFAARTAPRAPDAITPPGTYVMGSRATSSAKPPIPLTQGLTLFSVSL